MENGKVFLVREATIGDYATVFHRSPPKFPHVAYVAERDGVLLGGGGVAWLEGHYALGFFNLIKPVSAIAVHRAVIEFLEDCKAAEVGRIYVTCDRTKPLAEKWLAKLGFFKDPDNEGLWVLICQDWKP